MAITTFETHTPVKTSSFYRNDSFTLSTLLDQPIANPTQELLYPTQAVVAFNGSNIRAVEVYADADSDVIADSRIGIVWHGYLASAPTVATDDNRPHLWWNGSAIRYSNRGSSYSNAMLIAITEA